MRDVESAIIFERGDVASWTRLLAVMRKHRPNKIAHPASSTDMELLDEHPKQVYDQMVGCTVNVLEAMRLLGGVERLVNFTPELRVVPFDLRRTRDSETTAATRHARERAAGQV